jgi:outer membrane lipoprotein-sorting protein
MKVRWAVVCSALVVLSLVVGACQKKPTIQEIVDKMKEVEASTEDAHAIVEISLQDGDRDSAMVIEVWEKKPDKFRANLVESLSDEFLPGSVIVSDGNQVWVYDPGKNEVVVGEAGAGELPDQPENPRDIIRFVDEAIQRVLDRSDVKLVGEEDVAGVPTYVLEFTPKEGSETGLPMGGKGTLWVDQERWIVLQAHFGVGGVGKAEMRVNAFELNTGISDEPFRFQLPDGVEVKQLEDMRPKHLSLEEAEAHVEYLLVPAYVPDGTTLVDVFSVNGAYVLYYDHSDTSFTILQGQEHREMEPSGRTSEIPLRGGTAMLIVDDLQGNSFLTWTEDGVTRVIAGHIDQDEIVKVAESLQ